MNDLEFSTDKSRLDLDLIAGYLRNESYWAKDRAPEKIRKSIENSLCVGAYRDGRQIGFARVVSDYATVYYLADIFIIPELQQKGIGHLLMNYLDSIEELKGLRGILTTQTAHSFYEKFGYGRDNDIVQRRIMVR